MTATVTTCREQPDLQGYLENQLPLPERNRLERHLAGCSTCRNALESYRRLFSALDESDAPSSADAASPGRIDQLMYRLPMKSPPGTGSQGGGGISSGPWAAAASTVAAAMLIATGIFLFSRNGQKGPAAREVPAAVATGNAPRYDYSFLASPGSPDSLRRADTPAPVRGRLETGIAYSLPASGTLFVSFPEGNRLEFSRGARFSLLASGVAMQAGELLCDLDFPPATFTVTTPAGSLGTRGKRLRVTVGERGTTVRIDRGSVELRTPQARERLEHPGSRFLSPDGSIRSAPEGVSPVSESPSAQAPGPTAATPGTPAETSSGAGSSSNALQQGF